MTYSSTNQYPVYVGNEAFFKKNGVLYNYTLSARSYDAYSDMIVVNDSTTSYDQVRIQKGTINQVQMMFDYDSSLGWLELGIVYIDTNNTWTWGRLRAGTPEETEFGGNSVVIVTPKGEDILSNSTYDYKTTEGVRDVLVPASVSDLVGKTYTDVQNKDAVSNPPATGTTVGTADLVVPASATINLEPLKLSANLLTNRFPFSIPWDLKNAIGNLVSSAAPPKWTIPLASTPLIGARNFDIDFAQFEGLAKVVRWGVFVLFNFGLIMASRKLVGAGG